MVCRKALQSVTGFSEALWIGLDDVEWWAMRLLEARPCKWTCVLLLVGGGHGVLAG